MLRRRRSERQPPGQAEELNPAAGWPDRDLLHLPDWLALVEAESPAASGAVQVADELMCSIPGSAVARLDRDARRWTGWEGQGWWSLRAKDVPALAEATGAPVAVAAVASLHRDGHVREAAVRVLSRQWTGRELRWLLLRTADWVVEVRALATDAVRARVFGPSGADYLGPLADDVALVASRHLAGNPTGTQLVDEVRAVLQDRGIEELRAAAHSADRLTRRAAVGLLIGVEPPIDLLVGQLAAGDVVVLTRTARAAFATEAAMEAANMLLDSPWASVREEALWTVLDRGGPNQDLVERGLRDSSARVRTVAQRAAGASGIDAIEWYRAQVGTTPVVAMLGLGDIGGFEDAQLADLFVEARRGRLRAAAMRVVAQKGGSGFSDVLATAALADTGRVAQEAVRGLIRRGISDQLAGELWAKARTHHVGIGTSRVLGKLVPYASRWAALRCGLEALREPDASVVASGLLLLRRTWSAWNRSATEASRAERDALHELLEQAAPVLGKDDQNLLEAYRTVLGPAVDPKSEASEAPPEAAAESQAPAEKAETPRRE